jgi:D-alanyl-lipoteichoic acid acyltransferase DltB (MBOAT superfamily)
MEIISFNFVVFTSISLVIYHTLPEKIKNYWLLGISVFFYYIFSIRFALVLTILVLINFYLGKRAFLSKNKNLIWIPLILNIGSFLFIKAFSREYLFDLVKTEDIFGGKILLPIGFSYYMLQLISFQMDVRNGKFSEFPPLHYFSQYFFYFPKLLSGPIEKPRSFIAKLANPRIVDNELFSRALNMILLGLIRKLFIANILQSFLPAWNDHPESIGWIQAMCFVLYVYNDFAGYTLIVCGVSNLFGIELSPNFFNPLLARNFSEFWNRWHITLSTWLRENIYYPVSRRLSRNSGKVNEVAAAFVIPPLLTMLASGFWHNASSALLLWGTILGLFMIIERFLFETWPQIKKLSQKGLGRIIASVIIFLAYSFAMIPLASNSLSTSFIAWQNLLTGVGAVNESMFWPVVGLGMFSFFLDIMAEQKGKQIWWEDYKLIPRSAVVASGIMIVVISLLLIAFIPSKVFIYQGF